MSGRVDERDAGEDGAQVEITPKRLGELIRWHGTDESNLPPEHTLRHLSRDTVAALRELASARATIERLREAIGRAFWAATPRELNAILLEALGPPPAQREPRDELPARTIGALSSDPPTRLDSLAGRGLHHPGAARSLDSRL